MEKLKSCPFCGSEKLKIENKSGQIHHYIKDEMKIWQRATYSIRCNSCKARGGPFGIDIPIDDITLKKKKELIANEEVIKKWNSRV